MEGGRLRGAHSLAALLLYVAASELGLVQAVSADTTVLGHLAARALPTPPGAPALLHGGLLGCLVPGDGFDRLDGRSKRLSIF